jgi:uncharacterized membrane protein YbhN (UPF0104 family)
VHPTPRTKPGILFIVKVGLTILIFGIIISKISLPRLHESLATVSGVLFAAAALCSILGGLVYALVDREIILSVNLSVRLREIITINFSSYYFSFLSEIVGGAFRWHRFSGHSHRRGEALFMLGIERFLMVFLSYLVFIIAFYCQESFAISLAERRSFGIFIVTLGTILIGLLCFLFNRQASGWLERFCLSWNARPGFGIVTRKIIDMVRVLTAFRSHPTHLLKAILWFCMYITMGISTIAVLLSALHVSLPILAIVWMYSFLALAQSVPLTVYGLGVREGVLMFCLSKAGIPVESGLLLGFLLFLISIMLGSIGGGVHLWSGMARRRRLTKVSGRREAT